MSDYKKHNDSNRGGRVTGFKDGEPVYASNRGGSGRSYRSDDNRGGYNKNGGSQRTEGYRPRSEDGRADGGYRGNSSRGGDARFKTDEPRSYGNKSYNGERRDNFRSNSGDDNRFGNKNYNGERRDNFRSNSGDDNRFGNKNFRGNRSNSGDEGRYGYGKNTQNNSQRSTFNRFENVNPRTTAPVRAEEAVNATPNTREDELPYLVMGRNAVREAIRKNRSIDRIYVQKEPDGSLREILSFARDRNLRIDEVDRSKLDELCMPFGHGGKTGNHQGIVAQTPGVEYCELVDILDAAKAKGEKPFIILLDGIEDPHNLGSIIRSAHCAGAHGIVLPKRRAVSVTAAVCKASAGAVEHTLVARVSNLAGAMERLKDAGVWMAGADMTGVPMAKSKLEGGIGLVIGNEGAGLSKLIKDKCDFLVSIPMVGEIGSLNAAVAAAVLMFEKRRQDGR